MRVGQNRRLFQPPDKEAATGGPLSGALQVDAAWFSCPYHTPAERMPELPEGVSESDRATSTRNQHVPVEDTVANVTVWFALSPPFDTPT